MTTEQAIIAGFGMLNTSVLIAIYYKLGRVERSSEGNSHSINALWAAVNDLREKIK